MIKSIGLFVTSLLLGCVHAVAADITLRPDLKPRLDALYPIYSAALYPGDSILPAIDPVYGSGDIQIIKVSGAIASGDAAKLATLVNGFGGYGFFFVVFDSPGGNFVEGIKIGKYLQEFRGGQDASPLVGAIVLNGQNCLSACAVALSLAAAGEDRGYGVRYIEAGAELGFHMPFLPDTLANQTKIAGQMMNLTYDVVQEFSQIIAGGVSPIELLQTTLHHRTASSFFVIQGGLVSRYMGFTPVASGALSHPMYAYGLTMDHVNSLCGNLHFSRSDHRLNWMDIEEYATNFGNSEQWPEGTTLQEATQILGSQRLLSYMCAVEVRSDKSVGLWAAEFPETECAGSVRSGDWCAAELDEYSDRLDNTTVGQLADIFDCQGGTLTREYYHWSFPLAFDQKERGIAPEPLDRNLSVVRPVKLRNAPGLDTAVIGELDAEDSVTLRDCQLLQDSQGVWTQVDTHLGPGWVSARFLYDRDSDHGLRLTAH